MLFDSSVSEYITKRRLSKASKELLEGNKTITEIALEYQYGSNEAFSRAFKRFWGITPSEFRRTRRFFELHPRYDINNSFGGRNMARRKPLDVSELYDEINKRRGSYTLGIDIVDLTFINDEFGYAVGDRVIAEAFARIEQELSDDMLLFRTGGDEFAVVTSYSAIVDAESLATSITKRNQDTLIIDDHNVLLALRVGISRLSENVLNYQEALSILEKAVDESRKVESKVAVYEG